MELAQQAEKQKARRGVPLSTKAALIKQRRKEEQQLALALARAAEINELATRAYSSIRLQRQKEAWDARERLLLLCHPAELLRPDSDVIPVVIPDLLPLYKVLAVSKSGALVSVEDGRDTYSLHKWTLAKHGGASWPPPYACCNAFATHAEAIAEQFPKTSHMIKAPKVLVKLDGHGKAYYNERSGAWLVSKARTNEVVTQLSPLDSLDVHWLLNSKDVTAPIHSHSNTPTAACHTYKSSNHSQQHTTVSDRSQYHTTDNNTLTTNNTPPQHHHTQRPLSPAYALEHNSPLSNDSYNGTAAGSRREHTHSPITDMYTSSHMRSTHQQHPQTRSSTSPLSNSHSHSHPQSHPHGDADVTSPLTSHTPSTHSTQHTRLSVPLELVSPPSPHRRRWDKSMEDDASPWRTSRPLFDKNDAGREAWTGSVRAEQLAARPGPNSTRSPPSPSQRPPYNPSAGSSSSTSYNSYNKHHSSSRGNSSAPSPSPKPRSPRSLNPHQQQTTHDPDYLLPLNQNYRHDSEDLRHTASTLTPPSPKQSLLAQQLYYPHNYAPRGHDQAHEMPPLRWNTFED